MSNKRIMIKQISLYTIIFAGFSLTYTQIIPFLTYVGYDPVERGLILSAIAVIAIISQFTVGYLCDKYNTIKKFYNIIIVVFAILNALMYSVTQYVFFVHLILVALSGGIFRMISGLIETWTIETNEYIRDRFGSIRAFGAIGWALGAPLTSLVIVRFGYQAIGLSFALLVALSMLFSLTLPDAKKLAINQDLRVKDIKILMENPSYSLLLIVFILVNIVFTADMYTVIDKIIYIGGTNDHIALKWSFQALTELPLFFFGYLILKRIGAKKMLIIAIVLYMVRFGLYTVASTPEQIILISGMQAVTFPILIISQKVLISFESPNNLKSTGQMFAIALYSGGAALLTPIISGVLITSIGFDNTLMLMTISLLLPLGLAIKYKERQINSDFT